MNEKDRTHEDEQVSPVEEQPAKEQLTEDDIFEKQPIEELPATQPPVVPPKGGKRAASFRKLLTNRKLRYGGLSMLLTVLIIAIAVLANVAITAMEDKWNLRMDMTRNKMYSLTDATIDILSGLDQDIVITTLYKSGAENVLVNEMLAKYAARSSRITVQNVDPIRNPTYTQQFATDETVTIGEGYVIISNPEQTKFRALSSYQFYQTQLDEQTFEQTITGYQGEQVLTNAIVYVAAENTPTLYYLQGHLERAVTSFSSYQATLEGYNYSIKSLNMVTDQDVALNPKDVLVVASPRADLSDNERDIIKDFLMHGGRMVYFSEANAPSMPNFESLFELFGVSFNHDLAVELNSQGYYYDPTYIVPVLDTSHAIVSPLRRSGTRAVLAGSMSFTLPALEKSNVIIEPLLTTTADSFGRVDVTSESIEPIESDIPGPLTVGVAITSKDFANPDNDAQIVLYGTASYATDLSTYFSGNRTLYVSSVAWMSDQSDTVEIRAKSLSQPTLNLTSNAQIIWIVVIVALILPGIVLAAAIFVFLRRRHL